MTERANDLLRGLGSRRQRDGEQAQGDDCLSDLALDRLLLGEASAEQVATANQHLRGCVRCTQARAALAADREQFARETNVSALAADALARASLAAGARAERAAVGRRRADWLLRWLPALGLGAAVAAVVVLVPRAAREPSPLGDLQAKGAVSLALFVKPADSAPGAAGAMHLGEPLHPGDRVRIQVSSDRAGHLAVLALDTTGRVQVYSAPAALALLPGKPALLPGAIELDETLGKEVIVALRCEQPLPAEHLAAALQRAVDAGKVAADPAAALGRSDLPCAEARYVITKTARR